ncbi:hypothetical protein [Deinococcus misasensis]|uniref:hypothetical protein n=1 Tax=Deinococcus misasensis TaxID=392413 RepID=UPI000ACBC6C8|nr:hypothetical protein [Deinococcus misasensis]
MKTDHMHSVTAVFKEWEQAKKAIVQLGDQAVPAGYVSLVVPEVRQAVLKQQGFFGIPVGETVVAAGVFGTGQFADRLQHVEAENLSQALEKLCYTREEAGFYSLMLQDAVLMLVVIADTSIQVSRTQDIFRQHDGIIYHREKEPEEENLPRPSQML